MTITYTGQAAFTSPQQKKFEAKLAKVGKMLDRRGEKNARVILTTERHLHQAEITVHYYDHPLVGVGSNSDPLQAGFAAIEKLEKQLLKARDKWRDTSRRPVAKTKRVEPAAAPSTGRVTSKPDKKVAAKPPVDGNGDAGGRVYRVTPKNTRKPMTVEEAVLELTDGKSHIVFRDADTDRTNVLVRRKDGHFDLIEG